MNNPLQDGMSEATRLMSEGRLSEATALIQRTLGGGFTPPNSPGNASDPMETLLRIVDETAQPATQPWNEPGVHTLRPPERAKMPRPFRGTPPYSPGAPNVDRPDVAAEPGQFVERTHTNKAGTRSYKLYIPSGYVGQAVPLVVMLHGCTQNPDDFAAGTRMNALAEEHTFLVAYPAQTGNANMQKCWNWFQAADQQRGRGEPSIIAGITCEIVGEYHVALDRVYVAGMSAGGAMAATVGEAYPDIYAAVGVHSGLAPGAATDMSSAFTAMRNGMHAGNSDNAVPTIVFHGDRDTTVNPRNGEHLISHGLKATPNARAAKTQGQVSGGHSYTHAVYKDSDGHAVAEHWTVHGLGHAWSGGGSRGSYTDPKGPDASAEMMRFFDQHPRREA